MFDTIKFLKIMLKVVNNTMPLRIKSVIKKRDEITRYSIIFLRNKFFLFHALNHNRILSMFITLILMRRFYLVDC